MQDDDMGCTTEGDSTRWWDQLTVAKEVSSSDPTRAMKIYRDTMNSISIAGDEAIEDAARLKEQALYGLAGLMVEQRNSDGLKSLLIDSRPFFSTLPKARTAKIVRTLITLVSRIPNSEELQSELCRDCISWCMEEKRTFLRHRVETRLAVLYLQQHKYQMGLEQVEKLLKEVKKLDDKLLLVEIHLIESRLHYSIKSLPKSKAALTAARTNANAIHCPPLLQGEIDIQAGVVHAHEKDFKTAFSYFFEAFEAFSSASSSATSTPAYGSFPEEQRALSALKYMLLSKAMSGNAEEVYALLSGKYGMKFADEPDLDAFRAVAKCHKDRSVKMFESTLEQYKTQLQADPIVKHHICDLYESLLEQNIIRILEPYSRVEIAHVAKLIELPLDKVENKLAEMILDGKLRGTLNQGVGTLLLFDSAPPSTMHEDALSTIKNMADVVDTLYEKAQLAV